MTSRDDTPRESFRASRKFRGDSILTAGRTLEDACRLGEEGLTTPEIVERLAGQ
jgi:hypothetical protein